MLFLFLKYFKARDTYRILEGKRKEINYLEDLDVKGRVILKWILKNVFFFFGTEQWHAVVKGVMYSQVALNFEIFWLNDLLLARQKELCFFLELPWIYRVNQLP